MKQKPSVPLITYWYQALSSPFGVELVAADPTFSKQKLYHARSEARDESLATLSICMSPFDPNKLWIVRRERNDENEAA